MTTEIPKPFWASKTLWINLITLVAAISTAFGVDLGLDPEAQIAIVGTVMSVINIVLRFVTRAPVSIS
jgi:hypothetical protein